MYIAYSALHTTPVTTGPQPETKNQPEAPDNKMQLRYHAYRSVCDKYRQEIAAIQKHLPGWQPKFY